MPSYKLKNPATGKWHNVEFKDPPTIEDIDFAANHLATNVDTGQGIFTSALSSAARGATSVVGDISGGMGAIGEGVNFDNNSFTRTGVAIDQWAESALPINPAYKDSLWIKGAGISGQISAVFVLVVLLVKISKKVVQLKRSGVSFGVLGGVVLLLVLGYGLVQVYAGYLGIEHHWGHGWALAAAVVAFFGFTLPVAIGAFLCALNVWDWHWLGAALFTAPGLAFMMLLIPGTVLFRLRSGGVATDVEG